jgi:hypothetical protein
MVSMPAPTCQWRTYEEVATEILGRIRNELGVSSIEGKHSITGLSGTDWELDAKGIAQGSDAFVIVECRRHTTAKIKQEAVAALAFRIQDTGAAGGFLVSPLGFQEGATKVAASANIRSVVLNADATPEQFALRFLGNLFVGVTGVEARGELGCLTAVVENNVPRKD